MKTFFQNLQSWFSGEGKKIVLGIYKSASPKLWRAWGFGFLFLAVISFYKTSDDSVFFGVTESREIPFNFDRPVVLTRILVTQGQKVKKNDLLAEVDQPELSAKIVTVKAQLEDIKTKKSLLKSLETKKSAKSSKSNSLLTLGDDTLELREKALQEELSLYLKQKEELLMFAPENGTIGQVLFKVGENIPAFSSIMNMVPDWPTSIRGYLFENFNYEPKPGQNVKVRSLSNRGKSFVAKIVSVGDRIVPFPERLKTRPDLSVFGREILIKLPTPNNLLIGEKVFVEKHEDYIGRAIASVKNILGVKGESTFTKDLEEIDVPGSIKRQFHLEASGAVFLADLSKFLIASDDTGDNNPALLVAMSTEGSVDRSSIAIEGLASLSDLESMSQDKEGRLYALSSLQPNKDGNLPNERALLVRMTRNKNFVRLDRSVNLVNILKKLFNRKDWNQNIEGHFVSGDALYFAVREPLANDHSQIFRLSPLSKLWQKGLNEDPDVSDLEVSLWREYKFPKLQGEKQGISDLLLIDNNLFILSSCLKGEACGAFWQVKMDTTGFGQLNNLASFEKHKPEGIAFDSLHKNIAIFFDQGRRKPSLWTVFPWDESK